MYARFVLVVVEIKNKRKLLSRVRQARAEEEETKERLSVNLVNEARKGAESE